VTHPAAELDITLRRIALMPLSRRHILSSGAILGASGLTSAALAATPGNPDEPPQGIINTRNNPRSAADPGPQNPIISGQFPKAYIPPATDIGDLPLFWNSFN
jgi:oxalate decarboxylase